MFQLVIQFPLDTFDPSTARFDALISLEDEIERRADGAYNVDSHDVGSGEMNIFIITDNAVATFSFIEDLLPADVAWRVGFRDLDSDDYTPLAPTGLAIFEVV